MWITIPSFYANPYDIVTFPLSGKHHLISTLCPFIQTRLEAVTLQRQLLFCPHQNSWVATIYEIVKVFTLKYPFIRLLWAIYSTAINITGITMHEEGWCRKGYVTTICFFPLPSLSVCSHKFLWASRGIFGIF